MKTVTSISGGQSSAYVAANYPSDYLIFALVCIEDERCQIKDKKLVQMVSDRIGKEFIATAEDDVILHTIFDLEQYLGQHIEWLAGETFDYVADNKGGWLPNKLHRYCTVEMKLKPMFDWWYRTVKEPVNMQIGFRSGESQRAKRMLDRCNEDGMLEMRHVIGKHRGGRNKWAETAWQVPKFPMIDNGIRRDDVVQFWKDKPVRFAERNNCVGCFHRNPLLLRMMFEKHPEKMEWFASQERKPGKNTWIHNGSSYDQIGKHRLQHELSFDDFNECDSGHCGL